MLEIPTIKQLEASSLTFSTNVDILHNYALFGNWQTVYLGDELEHDTHIAKAISFADSCRTQLVNAVELESDLTVKRP